MKEKILIVDYGVGNIHSVLNAISYLGYDVKISSKDSEIKKADYIILPGVGAFDEAMKNLKKSSLDQTLHECALVLNKPILGICVGMQMFASESEENGLHEGLNWIPGTIKKLSLPPEYNVPHVGWNDIHFKNPEVLFSRLNNNCNFYFDHSYHFVCDDNYIDSYCEYGVKIASSVNYKNIFGVQFHPEKSQINGLRLFKGFFNHFLKHA